ncbi:C2 domain-containing protein [Phellopilus nigrolimitatus]|nr:C2 domain-containing protein [Phellopilus nigrolimitatus]
MASERSKDHQLGTLVVVVLKARNLPDKHTFTKQDPFAVVQLGSSKASTEVDKRGGQHPVWDQDLHVQVSAAPTKENRTLKVSCYAKESKSDDLIGEGEVDVSDTLAVGGVRWQVQALEQSSDNGAYRGEIYLEMTYFAAGPPKLERRPSKLAPSERLSRLPHAHPNTPPKAAPHATPYGPSLHDT